VKPQRLPQSTCPRSGVTMIEALTVLAIIGLLCALILPAVQSSREAARLLQCKTNLKQLALAVGNYEATFHELPHSTNFERYSCFVVLLSFLDQAALYDRIDFKTTTGRTAPELLWTGRPALLGCPSDPVVRNQPFRVSYNGNSGWIQTRADLEADNSNGVMTPIRYKVTSSSIKDGLTQTALFAEILPGGEAEWRRCVWYDSDRWAPMSAEQLANQCLAASGVPDSGFKGNSWTWGFTNVTTYKHVLPPNSRSCLYVATAGSIHSGGVNLALTDGSVKFVSDSININLWRAIGTRDGREGLIFGN